MAQPVDFARQAPASSGHGARQESLQVPPWVLMRVSVREKDFCGQLVINFFKGGVTNIEWRQTEKADVASK